LKTAATVGSTAYPAWGLSWSYDRYGNRKQESIFSGCVSPMTCPTNSVTPSPTTNRLTDTGYGYDLAGNMTSDGSNTLTYDAENRVTNSANGGSAGAYAFDGNSLRVQKTVSGVTTLYIFSGTKVIAEYASGAAPSSPSKEYIYAGSQLLATITGSTERLLGFFSCFSWQFLLSYQQALSSYLNSAIITGRSVLHNLRSRLRETMPFQMKRTTKLSKLGLG
jgi:hypothetical protein